MYIVSCYCIACCLLCTLLEMTNKRCTINQSINQSILCGALDASRSTEGLGYRSTTELVSARTEEPTEGWGGATPNRLWTCCRKASCVACKAWESCALSDDGRGPAVPGWIAMGREPGADNGRGISDCRLEKSLCCSEIWSSPAEALRAQQPAGPVVAWVEASGR